MRSRLLSTALVLFAASTSQAFADTMYKCVDAAGKISYTGQPCHGKASEAKAFKVDAPLDNQTLAAAEVERLRKLGEVKAALAQREAERRGAQAPDPEPHYRPLPSDAYQEAQEKNRERAEADMRRQRRDNRCNQRNPRFATSGC